MIGNMNIIVIVYVYLQNKEIINELMQWTNHTYWYVVMSLLNYTKYLPNKYKCQFKLLNSDLQI